MNKHQEAADLMEQVMFELDSFSSDLSEGPDYSWIAKVMTRESNIRLLAAAVKEANRGNLK